MKNLSEIYTPIGQDVVIEIKITDKTSSGLYLPDQAKSRSKICKVLAIGNDVKAVNVGDYVLVGPCSPLVVELVHKESDSINHVQIKEYQILGKVSNEYVTEIDVELVKASKKEEVKIEDESISNV